MNLRARGQRHDGPPRVAQICGATDGAQWMVDMSAGLRARGYDVTAIIGSAEGDTARRLTSAGVPYVATDQTLAGPGHAVAKASRFPIVGRQLAFCVHAASVVGRGLHMARMLREMQIDVAHSQIFNSILIGRIAAFVARVPVRIAMVPGPYHLETQLFRKADLRTAWMSTVLVGGSQRVTDLYAEAGMPARKLRTIQYGVDPGSFSSANPARFREELGIAADTPLVGQVAYFYQVVSGRLAPPLVDGRGIKGHEDFIDAAALILERRPDVRFVLVGGGWGAAGEEHRAAMQERCRERGIDHAVVFTGSRSDIPDALAALDVSVQCSLSENYGGTLESLLMERPTVATSIGGMPEVVRHEETGLLVPPRDPEALAAAILRLLDDPALGRELGRRGRQLVLERFTIQRTTQLVADLYEEQLGRRVGS